MRVCMCDLCMRVCDLFLCMEAFHRAYGMACIYVSMYVHVSPIFHMYMCVCLCVFSLILVNSDDQCSGLCLCTHR
jgi:hypothetical protein